VMLKVEPRFKLDCMFRGLYHVTGVTSTIVPISILQIVHHYRDYQDVKENIWVWFPMDGVW